MSQGDYVVHIGLPPVEGVVVGCQVMNTFPESYKVCVRLDDGRLYWDDLQNWNIVSSLNNSDIIVEDAEFRSI